MQPSAQQPGQKIDQELNASLTSTNQTISRLNEIQRDDGKLRTSALDLTELTTIAVPPGGTTGQVLAKTSNVSYATAWTTLSLTQYVEKANNLSDLANVATARANLGLGTMATQSASNYALLDSPALTGNPTSVTPATSDNDTSIATTAFVKAQGLVPVGGTAGQFLTKTTTGVDYATDWTTVNLSVYAVKANNLSDLTSASTARTNLGLGTMAIETASNYALLNAPIFTGDARAVTAALADNDTSIATTAFVQQELASGTANARNLEVYARNQTGSTIPIGSIVYINGATGNRPTITLAQANNDANSAQTIGFTKTAIANNGFGFVIIRGELENLDTSALTEGVQLYLSPTTAGTWTTTKPSAPQHLVYVGIVIRSHPTLGTILVSVQNGYEVAELHDSAISGLANNDLFAYESSTDLWKNKSFATLGLATSADAAATYAPKASPALTGNVTITANSANPALVITQDGAGDVIQFKDVSADTTYSFIDANGKVSTIASTTTNAGFNIPHGNPPTAPVNGDIWTTTANLVVRLNGTSQSIPGLGLSNTFSGSNTFSAGVTFSGANSTFGNSAAASTINLSTGATTSGVTKVVNVGTGGLAGSTTNIAIGSTTGTSTTTLQGITNGVTQAVGDNSTKLATTAFVMGNGGLTTNVWAPNVSALSAATSGTGANTGSGVSTMRADLISPNTGVAGYATRGFTAGYPSNSASGAYNFSTASGHSLKVYSTVWASTITGVKMRGVVRTNLTLPAPAILAGRGYGWEWDWATRTMNIIAFNTGTNLTTTAVTWNPANGRTYEITCTSDGAGTISLYVDGTLLGTSSGGPTGSSANQLWWQYELQSEATSTAQVTTIYTNPKLYTTNG